MLLTVNRLFLYACRLLTRVTTMGGGMLSLPCPILADLIYTYTNLTFISTLALCWLVIYVWTWIFANIAWPSRRSFRCIYIYISTSYVCVYVLQDNLHFLVSYTYIWRVPEVNMCGHMGFFMKFGYRENRKQIIESAKRKLFCWYWRDIRLRSLYEGLLYYHRVCR